MKKRRLYVILTFFTVFIVFGAGLLLSSDVPTTSEQTQSTNVNQETEIKDSKKPFAVYSSAEIKDTFETLEQAIALAETLQSTSVKETEGTDVLWNNYSAFRVHQNGRYISDFGSFAEAVSYAKGYLGSTVLFEETGITLWKNQSLPLKTKLIDAPLIAQMPELPRGCEVTSLTMLLQTAGVNVDKMTLAKEVKRDPTPYEKRDGVIYYGNPYDGFVGDMYTFDKPGYGVYHGPVAELAETYLPGQIIDMTGSELQDILQALDRGVPVWIISNTWFSRVPDSLFQTWQTPSGPVSITYKEHSVLITGYDEKYIYFNDPLANVKDRKIAIASFNEAYDQMGKQAITYIDKQGLNK